MKTFFEKTPSNSSSSSNEYEFRPIKGDHIDVATKDLFEQLEDGYDQYTCIFETIKEGANLYAKKTQGDFIGSFPIHIAAYNVASNIEAISSILQSFDDPEKRKTYIFKKNGAGKNALEILIENAGMNEELAIPSILSLLSYLTDNEQRELIDSLSTKAKKLFKGDENIASRQQDISDLGGLNYFFSQKKTIDMCRQRRDETEKTLIDYDSDEESLGQLDSVCHKKFTARVSYRNITKKGIIVQSIPELVLIPSDWRLETALQAQQGDHVTAYVLLLSSLSHCKGENVKKLPELIYKLAANVLPDDKEFFLKEKEKNDTAIENHRKIRVEAIASLIAHGNKEDDFIQAVENNLKKTEIELIARHVEDGVDCFIKKINQLENESLSQKRKESLTTDYILQQLIVILETLSFLKEKEYLNFKTILFDAIKNEAKTPKYQKAVGITDQTLKNITETLLKLNIKILIPPHLLSKSNKLTNETLLNFLKKNTPFKKYHEGYAINDIQNQILILKTLTDPIQRNQLLMEISLLCFKLFDYPRVNDNSLNSETILCQAIPRHMIIINAAFCYLNEIVPAEKKLLYDGFLANILLLQGWGSHQISYGKLKMPLSLKVLKEKILNFANLDADHNFSIKPKLTNQNNPVVQIKSNFKI
ncbi:MAG: hypothetical protein H0U70_11820 [Tatlockia sp.]|nr:hypothetical protein [Tatlockia sp.]